MPQSQRLRMGMARSSSKTREKDLIKLAKRLAKNPLIVLPECTPECERDPFLKTKKQLTRVKELADDEESLNSCMSMFKGKHLIQYSLDSAISSKVEEILIVVGYGAEIIINAFGITYRDIRVKYVLQKELCGPLDAIGQAREGLEDDNFILFQGDEIVCAPHPYEMIENFYDQDLFVECGVVQVSDTQEIGNTYGIIYDPYDYRIYRIVDKPRRPTNSFMGTGICVFRNSFVGRFTIQSTSLASTSPFLISPSPDDLEVSAPFARTKPVCPLGLR